MYILARNRQNGSVSGPGKCGPQILARNGPFTRICFAISVQITKLYTFVHPAVNIDGQLSPPSFVHSTHYHIL